METDFTQNEKCFYLEVDFCFDRFLPFPDLAVNQVVVQAVAAEQKVAARRRVLVFFRSFLISEMKEKRTVLF